MGSCHITVGFDRRLLHVGVRTQGALGNWISLSDLTSLCSHGQGDVYVAGRMANVFVMVAQHVHGRRSNARGLEAAHTLCFSGAYNKLTTLTFSSRHEGFLSLGVTSLLPPRSAVFHQPISYYNTHTLTPSIPVDAPTSPIPGHVPEKAPPTEISRRCARASSAIDIICAECHIHMPADPRPSKNKAVVPGN